MKNFKTLLPTSSKDVYYRNDIDNISTSHMKVMDDSVELDLRPRFPLFGGWKTHYLIGYNVPPYEYFFNSGDKHVTWLIYSAYYWIELIFNYDGVKRV